MNELVSIIMPAYNCADYIADSIRSVLTQTYTNWELLIVDDCSTDKTAEVIASFNDKRIRYRRNDHNMRVAATRNEAIKMAFGRYIAFLDSDDTWLPNKLELQIRFMQENNFAMTYTPYYIIQPGNDKLSIRSCPKTLTYYQLTKWNRIGCLTVIYDSHTLGKIFLPIIHNREDYGLWLLILRKGITAHRLNEPLARYRSHNGLTKGNKFAFLKYHYQMFHDVLGYSACMAVILSARNIPYYFIYRLIDSK